jgi:hypothetical protein
MKFKKSFFGKGKSPAPDGDRAKGTYCSGGVHQKRDSAQA